jgi:sugar (pentulose or hexulose) kinase
MQWLAGMMGLAGGVPALLGLAARSVPGANGVTFLPYLSSGEQGPLWDATLRGAILGLTLGHGQQDLARALVEGIAIETRRCVDVLNEAGPPVREITAAGIGATSPLWWQLLADVAGCVVTVPAANSGLVSAFGAALIGAQAVGADAGRMRAGAPAERFHPNQQSASLWADIIRRHDHGLAMISGSRQ